VPASAQRPFAIDFVRYEAAAGNLHGARLINPEGENQDVRR